MVAGMFSRCNAMRVTLQRPVCQVLPAIIRTCARVFVMHCAQYTTANTLPGSVVFRAGANLRDLPTDGKLLNETA